MVKRAHGPVMRNRVMFGKVIGEVSEAFIPVDPKMLLLRAVLNPEVAHIHGLGSAELDTLVSDASGSGVIGLNGSARLGEAEFFECGPNGFGFAGVVEEATEFGFGRGGNHLPQAMGDNEDWTVEGGFRGGRGRRKMGAKVEESSVARARVGFAKIRCVTVYV